MAGPSLETLNLAVLGPPGVQRQRTALALAGFFVYAIFAMLQHGEVMLGMIERDASNLFSATYLSGSFLWYLAFRAGWNLRVKSDPSLTLAQTLYAMFNLAWSYAITGPARGAILLIMVLVIVFGMFGLRPRQSIVLGICGFAMVATVMVVKSLTDPLRYDPRVEAMHLLFAGVVVAAVSGLAVRLGHLRGRLHTQKKELEAALSHIRQLATRDELTGLLNRRAMMEQLAQEARRVARSAEPMSLVLIDIDHFKRINDTHGHAGGDRVLSGFAALAGQTLRATDVLSRWGGEEFLLLMPATPADAAEAVVQRLRDQLRAHPFDAVAPGLVAAFSAGLTQCDGEPDLEAAIERADQAMYRAKNGGRDRTVRG